MYYQIHHVTRFRYSQPISEGVMEVRMQPRTEGAQRCLRFKLATNPPARVMNYGDHLGNIVHSFDLPGRHTQLIIQAESVVEIYPPPALPEALPFSTWDEIEDMTNTHDYWDFTSPSPRVEQSAMLMQFEAELGIDRTRDPLTLLLELNHGIYRAFDYDTGSTKVDSPIDVALEKRKGVCQDFAHIMLAIVRRLGIPARYVSGYLYYESKSDRSTPDASHAWVETLLPGLGWIGFDPTNNVLAGERHIRVAIGRDYSDVPPNKGVFKGVAESQLEVDVRIEPVEYETPIEEILPVSSWTIDPIPEAEEAQQQQQQQ
ncbi:MAG: transglutaminase domain-containing protein [Chloroflexi bacterium OLB15]|nr:MAG: transglutaminase domain-containing protein [Chloroflexi bacterium OLB15]